MSKIIGLDTLRFFAFFAIFLFHTTSIFKYGYFGVDFFFVLSSFLLTYLACKEYEEKDTFSRTNFFIRRALRIFPLYFLVIFFSFFIIPKIEPSASLPENKLLYLLFLSNYDRTDSLFALKFLWSIAVEEQFYFLFIFIVFLVRRKIGILLAMLLAIYVLFMFFAKQNEIPTYSNTIAHFPNFSAGILGGYLFYKKTPLKHWPILLLIISFFAMFNLHNELIAHLFRSLFFICLLLIVVQFSKYVSRFYLFKLTEKLGTYTYGLYVYSGFVITLVSKFLTIENHFLKFTAEFSILLIVSVISFHLFEVHFLKLKKFFR